MYAFFFVCLLILLELLPPVAPQGVTAETMLQSIRVTWMSSEEKHSKKAPLLGYRIVYGPTDDPSEINRMELGPTAVQFTIRGLCTYSKQSDFYCVS